MKRYPSVKTLSRVFGDDAIKARKILSSMSKQELIDEAHKLGLTWYHTPKDWEIKMELLGRLGDCYGDEAAQSTGGEWVCYINTGSTYNPSLIRWRGEYRVQSLGCFIETMARQSVHFE